MAVLNNGYVDDAIAYSYSKARFPNNFVGDAPDVPYRGALFIAGDIINSNDGNFIGEKLPSNEGEKVWPRQPVPGNSYDADFATTFLNGQLPLPLIRGYEWLGITVALSPEQFGTLIGSSSEVITTGGGLSEMAYDNIRLGFRQRSDDSITRSDTSRTPVQLQFHFSQALVYLKQLLRPGAELVIPGLEHAEVDHSVYANIGTFRLVRG